jgi:hypothetical protein
LIIKMVSIPEATHAFCAQLMIVGHDPGGGQPQVR